MYIFGRCLSVLYYTSKSHNHRLTRLHFEITKLSYKIIFNTKIHKVRILYLFYIALTRREYEKLDDLLRELIERDGRESHDSSCKDSDFGVMGDTCQDYLRDLYDNKLGEMCSSGYYKVHCCRTCAA